MILLDVFTFLGRMHPLIVHLPIGFLLAGLIFHTLAYVRSFRFLDRAVSFTLLIGFISAIVASLLGFMLSLKGDYDGRLLDDHKFSAIILTIMSGLLYWMTTSYCRTLIARPRVEVSSVAVVTFLALAYAGHKGAALTHGENYFSLETLTKKERAKPTSIGEALIFEDIVQPTLEKRCIECHRSGKRKGRLSMESIADIFKGGKNGPAVVARSLENSELYQRITLDPSHEDFMPADGRTPLSAVEKEMIRWWIEQGAPTDKSLSQLQASDVVVSAASDVLKFSQTGSVRMDAGMQTKKNQSSPVVISAIENLRNKGLAIRPLLQEPLMLDITMPPRSGIKVSEIEGDLKLLSESVIWLNLSDNRISADQLDILKYMSNLQKLRLEKNPLSDSISYILKDLRYLVAVNLNETNITQACVSRLRENQAIKRIYTWRTRCDSNKFER